MKTQESQYKEFRQYITVIDSQIMQSLQTDMKVLYDKKTMAKGEMVLPYDQNQPVVNYFNNLIINKECDLRGIRQKVHEDLKISMDDKIS
mmetsp:Transcript_40345/g.38823  ORF Transcript_40345/g.38823 Transcript_40345/m.38823 type:complete len:90 (+) Transcript_40345:598-867(+)